MHYFRHFSVLEKLPEHNLEKLCRWSLALTIPVLGPRAAVLENAIAGIGLGFFFF